MKGQKAASRDPSKDRAGKVSRQPSKDKLKKGPGPKKTASKSGTSSTSESDQDKKSKKGVAKKGVAGAESVGGAEVDAGTLGLLLEAAAAAAACKFAILLCKNSGTPEKARKFEASLSAANCLFHLFRRFWNHIFTYNKL